MWAELTVKSFILEREDDHIRQVMPQPGSHGLGQLADVARGATLNFLVKSTVEETLDVCKNNGGQASPPITCGILS